MISLERAAILNVALILQKNAKAEADANVGYTEQLQAVESALEVVEDGEIRNKLLSISESTKEKMSDELSHNISLIGEFVSLTGIEPAND